MRRSVVVLVAIAVVAAIGLLVFDARPDEPDAAPTRVIEDRADAGARPTAPVSKSRDTAAVEAVDIRRDPTDDHLLEDFDAARRGTTGAALFAAQQIEHRCFFDTRSEFVVGAALAGRMLQHFEWAPAPPHGIPDGSLIVTQARPSASQLAAARELHRRCEGFASWTTAMHRADAAALEERLLRTDDALGLAENIVRHRLPPTPDRLRTILASRDPVAITLLDAELASLWERVSRQSMPVLPMDATSPAMMLAGCDLGLDCGPSSTTALLGCLDDAAVYGYDVTGQLLRRSSPADRPRIDDIRTRIVAAVASGDYAIWGL